MKHIPVIFATLMASMAVAWLSPASAATVADTFKAPSIAVTWIYDTAKSVKITVQDSSNDTTGFIVYRADSLTAPFHLISQTIRSTHATYDSVIILDSTMALNSWNIYRVGVFKTGDTLFSPPCTTYLYKDLGPRQVIKFTKVGNYAIADTSGWSALVGDSIYLKQTSDPAGKFSVINVKNPGSPVTGTIDSAALLSYPMNTLIPVFIRYGVKNGYGTSNASVFNCHGNILLSTIYNNFAGAYVCMSKLLQINGTSLALLDSFSLGEAILTQEDGGFNGVIRFNDSTFGISYWGPSVVVGYGGQKNNFLLPFTGSSEHIFKHKSVPLSGFYTNEGSSYIGGLYNNKILVAGPAFFSLANNVQVYDLALDTCVVGGLSFSSRGTSQNSGYYFNSTMYFSDDTPYVYATDVRDVNGRASATANNAIISDTGFGLRQNLFIDTTRKLLFILYKSNLSTFSYSAYSTAIAPEHAASPRSHSGITLLPGAAAGGVALFLHGFSAPVDLSFYDISGRLIDRIFGITANAVRWKPKQRSMGCYIVYAKSGAETASEQFMVR